MIDEFLKKKLESLEEGDFIKYRCKKDGYYTYYEVNKIEKGKICGIKIKAKKDPELGFIPVHTHECTPIDEILEGIEGKIYIAKFEEILSS